MPNPIKAVGRMALGAVFIGGGLNQVTGDPSYVAGLVDKAKERYGLQALPASQALVRVNGMLMLAGGSALALGIAPRRSALLLAALLQPTNVVGHAFWTMEGQQAFAERNHFMSNLAITGGLLLAATD